MVDVRTASDLLEGGRPLLIAHRGASSTHPENTLPALLAGFEAGADIVELDYQVSADGCPVVFHDETLDRTTDAANLWGSGVHLRNRTLSDLRQLDAGSWRGEEFRGTRICTLAEALTALCPIGPVMIERKAGRAKPLVDLVRSLGVSNCVFVHAFDWRFLAHCRRLAPALLLGALGDGELNAPRLSAVANTKASIVGWKNEVLVEPAVRAARAAGYALWVWTVDDIDRGRELLAWGASALITNRPAALRPIFSRR